MPKVKDEYLQNNREQILDATHRVCMQKPVYFKPQVSVQDIFEFIEISIDGIQRDIVLHQCYQLEVYTTFIPRKLDLQKLMNVLCKSVIYLLGGDPDKKDQ